jgi:diguanylate cyclase (GGDEF)-like protein/PAS domain S-box-containing protein
MIQLSVLSYAAAIMYFIVGFNAYKLNKKSELCRLFFIMTISMTIWSSAWGFLYLAEDAVDYSFWNKISAFGWCTFEAIVLYFVMVLTRNRLIRHWYIKLLVLLPAAVSLYMVLFLFGPGIDTDPLIAAIFYNGNFIYNFSYLLLSIFIIIHWGYKSSSRIQKKQAFIISLSSFIPFVLNLIFQNILPAMGLFRFPNMGQIFTLIMLWGVNYSIIQYQFMSIPTTLITNELFQELNGLTFLINPQGYIIKSNRQVYALLEYREDEMSDRKITDIIRHPEIEKLMGNCEAIHKPVRLTDLVLASKTGNVIPFNISIVPLHSKSNLLLGFLIVGEDMSATKELYDEIKKHKLTNEKLANSERLSRTILEIAPVPILLTSKHTGRIMYLNTQAQELFGADKSELIGSAAADYMMDPQEEEKLLELLGSGKTINNKEVVIRRKNGSEIQGILTMIPSVYQEEEVSLSCIIDITSQKKIEETLKQNNENINKLNSELVTMNNILINKSIKDSLTNLYNHQYINEVLENLLHKTRQDKSNLSIMMLDIDYFKRVNDQFGHLAGDQVLVTICELISQNVRKEDFIGRYGGEEFLVILPGIRLDTAARIAESIRRGIQTYDFGLKDQKVTISIGVAQYAGETSNVLINKADMLLYQAKSKGRNRVEIIPEEKMV